MKPRNIIGVILILVSFGLLYPGLTKPMLTLSASISAMGFTMELMNTSRSILQTVDDLIKGNNHLVAGLIFLFSVAVPVLKGLLLLLALSLTSKPLLRFRIDLVIRSISKWSMADVFVVGIFIAFLSGEAMPNFKAVLGEGFYYFTGYCLVSIASLHFIHIEHPSVAAAYSKQDEGDFASTSS